LPKGHDKVSELIEPVVEKLNNDIPSGTYSSLQTASEKGEKKPGEGWQPGGQGKAASQDRGYVGPGC